LKNDEGKMQNLKLTSFYDVHFVILVFFIFVVIFLFRKMGTFLGGEDSKRMKIKLKFSGENLKQI